MKRFIPVLFILCACSSDPDLGLTPEVPVNREVINLYSTIGSITAGQTRGDGTINGSTLASDLSVSFVRIDKTLNGDYPSDYTDVEASLPATIGKADGMITFATIQRYLADGGSSKFIGWYPAAEATVGAGTWNADGTVTFPAIDGSTDILAGTMAEGSKTNLFSTIQHKLTFNHMLTQIRVFAYFDSEDYREVWGDLTGITVAGKKQTCTLTLPATTAGEGTSSTATFASDDDLPLLENDNSGPIGTKVLLATAPNPSTDAPIGYAMFAPHESESDKLTLNVTTEIGGTNAVDIPYSELALQAGKSYHVILKLQAKTITTAAVLTDWVTAPSNEQPPVIGIGGSN